MMMARVAISHQIRVFSVTLSTMTAHCSVVEQIALRWCCEPPVQWWYIDKDVVFEIGPGEN